ncbi:MAG TPA: TlpA disulfide reductase family protein [Allosphingosinicella sp.]|jgi:thiol-disulfide isomerase/thioredoxin
MRWLLLVLMLLAACQREAAPPAPEDNRAAAEPAPAGKIDRSHAGKAAPATSFEDPDGEAATLAGFEGRPLLVNLWATWCGPCVKEMPTLDRLAAAQAGRLQVVAISQDMEGRDKVEAFFRKAKLTTLEPYLDAKLALMGDLGVEVLPTTILFDAEGREVWRVTGEEDWEGPRAAALVKEAFRRGG